MTMKHLITTCYGRVSKLPKGTKLVQTSNGAPDFMSRMGSLFEPDLTPEAFRNKTDFRVEYPKQLERLYRSGKLKKIVDRLPEGAALLCFEADHCDCHRKILADKLNEWGLAEVHEFTVPAPVKPVAPVNPQMSFLTFL